MSSEMRLYQAALELDKVLTENKIGYGIFGGWAINALGSDRGTKDIDCFVAAEKEDVGRMFLGKRGWNRIPGQRQDYIAFLVGERTENVLVEFFPASTRALVSTEAMQSTMQTIATRTVEIRDHKMRLLDIVYIFKGKVNAAANRPKVSDCSDIEFLYARFESYLRTQVHRINVQDAGKAIKRYPSLSTVFGNLGIDVHKAVEQAGSLEITSMHPPPFLCQKALME